jgi:hypothetical protein
MTELWPDTLTLSLPRFSCQHYTCSLQIFFVNITLAQKDKLSTSHLFTTDFSTDMMDSSRSYKQLTGCGNQLATVWARLQFYTLILHLISWCMEAFAKDNPGQQLMFYRHRTNKTQADNHHDHRLSPVKVVTMFVALCAQDKIWLPPWSCSAWTYTRESVVIIFCCTVTGVRGVC